MGILRSKKVMGQARQILQRSVSWSGRSSSSDNQDVVPKGHFPVYVGDCERRFVVPVSYLKFAPFQRLLESAAEEFGYDYCAAVLRVPCQEETFLLVLSQLERMEQRSAS